MNKNISTIKAFYYILCVVLACTFPACSEDRNFAAGEEVTGPVIEKLDALIHQMRTLQEEADYGEKKGQYPAESRSILENAIDDTNRAVLLIKYQKPAPSQEEKNRYVSNAENAIEKFKESVRTEDVETIPAVLFVDGKSNQSYIDFGRSRDFTVFGDQHNQEFTIEFWAKVKEGGANDNYIFLSTFFSNDSDKWRNGWMMYWRVPGIIRTTWGRHSSGDRFGMSEPATDAPDISQWNHYVTVYSDKGLDGNTSLRAKMYINGVMVKDENADTAYNSSDYDNYDKPMTAFCRWVNDNKMEEGFSGYMKYIRIWKMAKDEAYIQASYNEEVEVDGKDASLVAGWDFASKPTGRDSEILDITGRHTAKVIGTYKWEVVKD
ncbi:MAG: DUF4972 domain-containing protein [Tannerellaceae bacterium]|nr:DUF4972 domain-containing protein [Tannerellaceae bacterium]